MDSLKTIFLVVIFFFSGAVLSFSQEPDSIIKVLPEICLSETEENLLIKINEYRETYGLPAISLSKSLTYVAQYHAWDLAANHPVSKRCNLHSWSSNGPWTSCCYGKNHQEAECMWNKPRELTNYPGDGYEIAYWTNEPLPPEKFAAKALLGWKRSSEHNEVILNQAEWRKVEWNAIGVGYQQGYAVIWFGILPDEEKEIHLCVND